jgi:hypothetical protein
VQATPQAPQFAALESVSTQAEPQRVVPAGHTHMPIAQVVPRAQTVPQAPQLAVSLVVSTHAPLHVVRPIVQVIVHTPDEHTWPMAQAVPQAPQWAGLDCRSTHASPQRTSVPMHGAGPASTTSGGDTASSGMTASSPTSGGDTASSPASGTFTSGGVSPSGWGVTSSPSGASIEGVSPPTSTETSGRGATTGSSPHATSIAAQATGKRSRLKCMWSVSIQGPPRSARSVHRGADRGQ